MSGPGRDGAIRLRRLGIVALATVAVAVTVTLWSTRHVGDRAASTPTPLASSSALAAGASFAPPTTDMFGRRVDVPNNIAGQALAQNPAERHRAGAPGWTTGAPTPAAGQGVWQRIFDGPVVRFSASDGPARIDGKAATGFARTPQGAALAAEQNYWRTNANPTDRELLTRLVDVTPQYLAQYDALVAAGKVSPRLPDKLTPLLFASDAFRVATFDDDHAVVEFARKAREVIDGQPTWVGMRLAVVWRDGDWKLTAVDSEQQVRIDSLRSIEGWTTW
ncbi:hypothetical protein DFR76_103555 [Nocardia pseudobrasiliensis]|uniref:DUF8175 domain-containing protein n=1 Tax=Nocardia pseudobrasiliensis TaxID=45979 RepID=A0A370IDJ9_9NOCA|nr:hypothetical protein DFR76_103555 [Nocardia pseudobrasiliensis]